MRRIGILLALLLAACDPKLHAEVGFFTDSTGEFSARALVHQLGARTPNEELAAHAGVIPGRAYWPTFPASIAGIALTRDIDFLMARAQAASQRHSLDVAVVMLGTNDVCASWSPDLISGAMDTLLASIDASYVLWLRLPTTIDCPNEVQDEPERIQTWNTQLEEASARHPRLTLLEPTGLELEDGLHFTPESETKAAQIIVRALDALPLEPAPEQPTPTPAPIPAPELAILQCSIARLQALHTSNLP